MTQHKKHGIKHNPITLWLRENNMWGNGAKDKLIPDWFMQMADDRSVSEILQGLIETDGSVINTDRMHQVQYSTTSYFMAIQIMYLFTRLGIFSTIDLGFMSKKATTPCYKIRVLGDEINKFRNVIHLSGYKGEILRSILVKNTENNFSDRISLENTRLLCDVARINGLSITDLGYRFQNKRINQTFLRRALENLKNKSGITIPKLEWLVNDSIVWDMVSSITDVGEVPVFDRSVPSAGNYVVNGIVVHNSGNIEQDADKVIFISQPGKLGITEDSSGTSTEDMLLIQIAKNRQNRVPDEPIKARINDRCTWFYDWDDHFFN